MSLLKEIRQQPKHLRVFMFSLSLLITFSLVGVVWFGSFQQNMYALLNPEEQDTQGDQVARETQSPFSLLKDAFSNTAASIFGFFGKGENDNSNTVPQASVRVTPHAFPLSDPR